jgi:excisionase family DNA binding protein
MCLSKPVKAQLSQREQGEPMVVVSTLTESTSLFLSANQAAHLLQLSRRQIYKMMERQEIPFRKFGDLRRIPREAIERMAKETMAVGSKSS